MNQIVTKARMSFIDVRFRFHFTPAIIASSLLVSVLLMASITIPLAYSQQFTAVNPITNPIKHIVVIMQENRSFDNYFGTYPGANGIPKNVCMSVDPDHPNNGHCVKPFLSTNPISEDMPHGAL